MQVRPWALAVLLSVSAGAEPVDVGHVETPLCTGHWCWEYPRLTTGTFFEMAGSSGEDLWLPTYEGVPYLLHWNGKTWSVALTTQELLFGVEARAPDNVWVVGERGLVMHWNGKRWTRVRVPSRAMLRRVVAPAPDDVWILGDKGEVLHYDGKGWSRL